MLSDNWLSAGSHTFDFHFNLPPRLPSTFASKIGHVSYFVQASCMGREHVLAKKRTYLLIQGTSDLHQENALQVVIGEEQGSDLSSKLTGGRGRWEGRGQRWPPPGRRKRHGWFPRPSSQKVNQKPGQAQGRGLSTRTILPPQGHWVVSRDICGCHSWGEGSYRE